MGSNVSVSNTTNGIFDVIRAVDRGELSLDLETAVRMVVDAVREQQKPGKVTLDLNFSYDSSTDAMRVSGSVKKSLPQRKSKASLFFFTPEGFLSRLDSRQNEMFIAPPVQNAIIQEG